MYNEKTRKLTSLTLMTIMFAGGLTFAIPGALPAAHAEELFVSAGEIGNFAGIQVIEIVIDDPERSDSTGEGQPNVTLNNKDVHMTQGTDGIWYAYVVNELAIENYGKSTVVNDIFKNVNGTVTDTGAEELYAIATEFLDGAPSENTLGNNDPLAEADWPFIQAYDISDDSTVTIKYGSGSSAETINLDYEYDDTKDLSFDRQKYPENAFVHLSLDDSLLNLSPTADDVWVFFDNGTVRYIVDGTSIDTVVSWDDVGFENGPIDVNNNDDVLMYVDTEISSTYNEATDTAIILKTNNNNENLFVNFDNTDESGLLVVEDGSASVEYDDAHSILYDTFNGAIKFDNISDEWLPGVELDIHLTDQDRNLNSRSTEELEILDDEVPFIEMGNPVTVDELHDLHFMQMGVPSNNATIAFLETTESKVATINGTAQAGIDVFHLHQPWPYQAAVNGTDVFTFINFDFTNFGGAKGTFYVDQTGTNTVSGEMVDNSDSTEIDVMFPISTPNPTGGNATIYLDVFSFGQEGDVATDGEIEENVDRVNDAFYRFVLEETDDNTAMFEGSVEYIMINQLNVDERDTYEDIDTADDSVKIIVNDDMDGADAVRVSYEDVSATSNLETISAQEDANTHTGKVELDKTSYSAGQTIVVTLTDVDLNTDSDTIQIYEVDETNDWVGDANVWLAQLIIDDRPFADTCNQDLGLSDTGFSFVETSDDSGVFEGSLELPAEHCTGDDPDDFETTNGLDIDFKYQDYSDASGKPNQASAGVSVKSVTGSVSLDRTVYPVPIGDLEFALHGVSPNSVDEDDYLDAAPVVLVVHIDDPDFNQAANGEDTIDLDTSANGNFRIEISRGGDEDLITTDVPTEAIETDPQSGIFEVEVEIEQDHPDLIELERIQQGDIITVTYVDPNDASGNSNSVAASATFDLRNAVLNTDKPTYVIGGSAIITLIEPDLNLDSETAETWSLDLINWDSDAGDVNLSGWDGDSNLGDIFDAEPAGLRETGDNTGIFQVVIEIPQTIDGDALERGELITLEYTDEGPAGADFVGDDDEDIKLDIRTSDLGASIDLDQKVYTWTDKIFITIVAPDHNFDSNSIDEIGGEDSEINIATREGELEFYSLVETGTDTGIFTGEVILIGFSHDADGDGNPEGPFGTESGAEAGPTDGFLGSSHDDGITVSFQNSEDDIAIGSALIRWNIGEIQWLEASYASTGTGVIRVIDPDMNTNPESVDSFDINVWSDTAVGGINLSVTETNKATGIFEGTVFFTTSSASSGSRLAVEVGDTITAEYEDNTLPDPYSTADELSVTATANIGSDVPPLERVPATNLVAVDAFGNTLDTVTVDQQIQVQANLQNGQDVEQEFAYLVQVQDKNGVTVSLAWITGDLTPDQNFQPALSWIPDDVGEYTATAFVWESIDNPTALSPPVTTEINVG